MNSKSLLVRFSSGNDVLAWDIIDKWKDAVDDSGRQLFKSKTSFVINAILAYDEILKAGKIPSISTHITQGLSESDVKELLGSSETKAMIRNMIVELMEELKDDSSSIMKEDSGKIDSIVSDRHEEVHHKENNLDEAVSDFLNTLDV